MLKTWFLNDFSGSATSSLQFGHLTMLGLQYLHALCFMVERVLDCLWVHLSYNNSSPDRQRIEKLVE
jgi:hypothetical protein